MKRPPENKSASGREAQTPAKPNVFTVRIPPADVNPQRACRHVREVSPRGRWRLECLAQWRPT